MKKLYNNISSSAESLPYLWVVVALVASVAFLMGGHVSPNTKYALSGFPEQLFAGKLAFSSEMVSRWYEFFIDNDTLDLHIITQYIDFISIFGLMGTIFFTQLLLVKLIPKGSEWRKFAVGMRLWGQVLVNVDIWENITTLTILSRPMSFAPWHAYLASSFTVWEHYWSLIGTSLMLKQI